CKGVSYGALLFLLAGGLSLIFGMMRIVNMTHGSYYLLGGYVALTVIWRTGSFVLAVLLGALTISLVGIAEWNAFLKRLSGQELGQVLTTMGFALIFRTSRSSCGAAIRTRSRSRPYCRARSSSASSTSPSIASSSSPSRWASRWSSGSRSNGRGSAR